ncbi:sulfotransferase family protein [Paenibacillus hexagrammi]|uniref:Sulfotransferase n=1 Tax=Paenibacillus hexagrammi TaxID=2908839 RepID=A0ABY3SK07_9BACL|nr:sulfotransferase [Paenibacillus sp. YPD9-1]UJF34301.1 sulfotransferase [Paenibacillus sp. YPD9-1]
MINAQGKNLVFLLCVPRSGSSLATVMLQNHSKIFATQEMWFLMSLLDLKHNQHRPYGGMGIINQFFNGIVPDEVFQKAARSFSLQVYNGLLQSSEAEIVVDKSPRYYYLLEFIDSLFPQSKRIWLIRNPLSILSSYKKVESLTNSRFSIENDLLNPQFNIKMTDLTVGFFRYYHYFSSNHPLAYRLQYEKLVSNPVEEMRKVCKFLEITYEEDLEKYGEKMHSSKSDLFYSMGVGDPFLAKHSEPHRDSIDSWKDILSKKEVEMYCQVLGARIFHELGYSDVLEEAEKWTGVKFDAEPDMELIRFRTEQLNDASGHKWENQYEMKVHELHNQMFEEEITSKNDNYQLIQLQTTLSSLEIRLENSYIEQKRLRSKLEKHEELRGKINRLKSIVPFGNRISSWASEYLVHRGRE